MDCLPVQRKCFRLFAGMNERKNQTKKETHRYPCHPPPHPIKKTQWLDKVENCTKRRRPSSLKLQENLQASWFETKQGCGQKCDVPVNMRSIILHGSHENQLWVKLKMTQPSWCIIWGFHRRTLSHTDPIQTGNLPLIFTWEPNLAAREPMTLFCNDFIREYQGI